LLWEFAVKRADSAPEDRTVRLSRSRNKVLAFDYTWLDDPMEERF
jgi:hypothetical protein